MTIGSGAVGDATWVGGKKPGIQSGHSVDDANFTVSDVQLPAGKSWQTPTAGKYKINGVNYKYFLNSAGGGAWKMSQLSDSVYVASPEVILYVTDDIKLGSGAQIMVNSGASFSLYVGAASASVGGNGVVNEGGLSKDFTYYGLPSNTTLDLGANASFTGYINAPNADFELGGGGNNTYDFVGACLVKSVTMNGHFNFHYDESLVNTPTASGYVVIAWDEL